MATSRPKTCLTRVKVTWDRSWLIRTGGIRSLQASVLRVIYDSSAANPMWAPTQYNPRLGSRHDFLA